MIDRNSFAVVLISCVIGFLLVGAGMLYHGDTVAESVFECATALAAWCAIALSIRGFSAWKEQLHGSKKVELLLEIHALAQTMMWECSAVLTILNGKVFEETMTALLNGDDVEDLEDLFGMFEVEVRNEYLRKLEEGIGRFHALRVMCEAFLEEDSPPSLRDVEVEVDHILSLSFFIASALGGIYSHRELREGWEEHVEARSISTDHFGLLSESLTSEIRHALTIELGDRRAKRARKVKIVRPTDEDLELIVQRVTAGVLQVLSPSHEPPEGSEANMQDSSPQ